MTWYVIVCRDCDGDNPSDWMAMPFESVEDRGRWAGAHTRATGHQRWWCHDQARTDTRHVTEIATERNKQLADTFAAIGRLTSPPKETP